MAQEFLTSILPRRGPEAFGKFIAALMSCPQQQFIAEELDPQLARRFRGVVASPDTDVDTTDAAIIREVTGGTCILPDGGPKNRGQCIFLLVSYKRLDQM